MDLVQFALAAVAIASTLLSIVLLAVFAGIVLAWHRVSRIVKNLELASASAVASSRALQQTTQSATEAIVSTMRLVGSKQSWRTIQSIIQRATHRYRRKTEEDLYYGPEE